MTNSFESINNLEGNVRKTSVVQERTGLVAVHMYKQFMDFQKYNQNINEIFFKMTDIMSQDVESLKQSFSVRNVPSGNIYYEVDSTKTVATINILWHTISFTSRFNITPQALKRVGGNPIFCGRIFAIKGNFTNLMQGIGDYEGQMKVLLDNEIASLYVPAEKNQSVIMTIRHKDNQESMLSHVDAPREIVCAGGDFHEQPPKPNSLFNF